MRSSLRRAAFAALLLAFASCGRSGQPPADLVPGPVVEAPLRCSGRLILSGSLAAAREGGMLVRLVEQATGRVLLQRIYDLGDPLWDRREAEQALYFGLDPDFAFDAAPPIHAPLVVEAVHLPPGVAAEPGASDERVAVVADVGARDLQLALHGAAAVAGAHPPQAR